MRTLFGYLSLIFSGLQSLREGQQEHSQEHKHLSEQNAEVIEQNKRIIELFGQDDSPLPDYQTKIDELAARLKEPTDKLADAIAADHPQP